MAGYWNTMAAYGWCDPVPDGTIPPGLVDETARATALAEIDAIIARDVFGLDELASILDTFPVLRRREERIYREYRTKRLILDAYDAMGRPDLHRHQYQYQTIVDPPPGEAPRHPAGDSA